MQHLPSADAQMPDLYKQVAALPVLGMFRIFIYLFIFNRNIFCEEVCTCWFDCQVLYRHILKRGSYCMMLVCLRFCFTEAELAFFYVVVPKWVCEGCSGLGCDWAKQLYTFLILKKCIKPLTSVKDLRVHSSPLMNWWCLIVTLFHIFKQISGLL